MRSGLKDLLRPTLRPAGLIEALGLVACAATALGFLGSLSWALDLFSHFRAQYALGLLVIGAALALWGSRRMAVACVGGALLNLGVIEPMK